MEKLLWLELMVLMKLQLKARNRWPTKVSRAA